MNGEPTSRTMNSIEDEEQNYQRDVTVLQKIQITCSEIYSSLSHIKYISDDPCAAYLAPEDAVMPFIPYADLSRKRKDGYVGDNFMFSASKRWSSLSYKEKAPEESEPTDHLSCGLVGDAQKAATDTAEPERRFILVPMQDSGTRSVDDMYSDATVEIPYSDQEKYVMCRKIGFKDDLVAWACICCGKGFIGEGGSGNNANNALNKHTGKAESARIYGISECNRFKDGFLKEQRPFQGVRFLNYF